MLSSSELKYSKMYLNVLHLPLQESAPDGPDGQGQCVIAAQQVIVDSANHDSVTLHCCRAFILL